MNQTTFSGRILFSYFNQSNNELLSWDRDNYIQNRMTLWWHKKWNTLILNPLIQGRCDFPVLKLSFFTHTQNCWVSFVFRPGVWEGEESGLEVGGGLGVWTHLGWIPVPVTRRWLPGPCGYFYTNNLRPSLTPMVPENIIQSLYMYLFAAQPSV